MAQVPPPQYDYNYTPPSPQKSKSLLPLILIIGCGGLFLLCAIGAAILFPVFAQARLAAQMTACRENMSALGIAMERYVDETGKFPTAETWSSDIEPFLPTGELVYHCPALAGDHGIGVGYAFNLAFADKKVEELETLESEPVLSEVDQVGRNVIFDGEAYGALRHMNGRAFNAYFFQEGVVRMEMAGPYIPVP